MKKLIKKVYRLIRPEREIDAIEWEIQHNCILEERYARISDEEYNRSFFKKKFGYYPNLDNPQTFSEKLLYLKMHYQNPIQNQCADKFTVLDYVCDHGYPDIIKKVYQVCEDPEEINLDLMPDQFFIQCSHTQGNNFVIRKTDLEQIEYVKRLYAVLLKRKHYMIHRENCYKNIVPRIICSEYLTEPFKTSLTDYKFYCFDGEPKYFMVSYGEFEQNVRNHKFDMNWNSIDHLFKKQESVAAEQIIKPENFERMVEIAQNLSVSFPHVRVDLYNISGRIVFGEMTFYSAGGFVKVEDEKMNRRIGSWINLEKYKEYLK